MQRVRIYHAMLAVLALLTYVTGELGVLHAWLGYGVLAVISFRLLWGVFGNSQLRLSRFYPSFEGINIGNALTYPSIGRTLILGVALSLLAATITGVVIDKGESIGFKEAGFVATAYASDNEKHHEKENIFEEALEELHEFFANIFLFFVGMHISHMILFRWPLARYMLFFPKK